MALSSVLKTIAARLGRPMLDGDTLEHRFAELKAGAPAPVTPPVADAATCFIAEAEKNLFEISRHSNLETLIAYLAASHLAVTLSPQTSVRALDWRPLAGKLTEDYRAPALGVVEAVAGIAETGTVAIRSTDVPSGLLFLSEELVIILRQERILALQEELWQTLPLGGYRALHLISGPSRTADVEQTLQVGAHGPRRVYLWLVTENGGPASPAP
jgi:L-lactate utilization protein LutC